MLVEEVDPAGEVFAGGEGDGVEDAEEEAVGGGVGIEAFVEVELLRFAGNHRLNREWLRLVAV